ncbi:TRM11 family methyltransferase [Saccharibacillus sp. JS10]|uniref:TRM11 family SAM-dependent methyltransferase n=1 Tax=Saccharibacillus sp. JS10 TaxID=2950552 RepID=UPI00210C3CE4|nr:RNA methyltransferase [Saccharibacillus sp. JS10]MCQ4086739.1 RNA methyltransferase [Saccharibacillus sp. JS10]
MESPDYIYDFACHEDERELFEMELRALLDAAPTARTISSQRKIDPSRSPFLHGRLTIEISSDHLEGLAQQASQLELDGETFKLQYIQSDQPVSYDECRRIERLIGAQVRGTAKMKNPQRIYGVTFAQDQWILGDYVAAKSLWLAHQDKPRQYSTALGTRTARAIANIAVPDPTGVRAVDPCCGIGTVLIEAKSMGISIDGFDLNPLAAIGARENLAHFNLSGTVVVADMRKLEGNYDALILDLPYNLCSVLVSDERLEMLQSAYRLASRCVIVATEDIGAQLEQVGFSVIDHCVVRKGKFARHIWLSQSF